MANLTQKILIGLALAGLLGILVVVGVFVGSAVIGWKAALRAGNEAATIQNLKTIAAVEIQYYNTHLGTFGTFDQMVSEKMLSAKFSGAPTIADGYVFTLNVISGTSSSPSAYRLNADPRDKRSGIKHFYMDALSGEIRVNADRSASASDPPLSK